MAIQLKHFACTLNPGSTPAAPQVVPMALGTFTVRWVELDVPLGPAGAVGFYVASSGQQVIPFRSGASPNWLKMNDDIRHWDLEGQPDSGDWSLVGYNQGRYPHTVYLVWGLDLVALAPPGPPALIPATSLAG